MHIHTFNAHKSSSVLLLTNLLKQQLSLCVSICLAIPMHIHSAYPFMENRFVYCELLGVRCSTSEVVMGLPSTVTWWYCYWHGLINTCSITCSMGAGKKHIAIVSEGYHCTTHSWKCTNCASAFKYKRACAGQPMHHAPNREKKRGKSWLTALQVD